MVRGRSAGFGSAGKRGRRQPYAWLGAGAVTLGIGVALAGGAGVASAETDDASNSTSHSAAGMGSHNPVKGNARTARAAGPASKSQRSLKATAIQSNPTSRVSSIRTESRVVVRPLPTPEASNITAPPVASLQPLAGAATPTANVNPLDPFAGVRKNIGNIFRVNSRWAITGLNGLITVFNRNPLLPNLPHIPVPGLPTVTKATATSRLWDRLMAFTDPGVDVDGFMPRIVQGADGQTRLVVYIGGTTPFNGANQPALDNPAKLEGKVEAAQLTEVLNVLGGDKSLPIMLTGFSQGGMDAQNLANALYEQGYNVKGVVCFASPFSQDTPAPYPVVYLRDKLDPVAVLQRPNVAIDMSKVFTDTSSSDKDPGIGNINVHINDATYSEIAKKFDVYAGGFTAIKRVIRDFEPSQPVSDTEPPTQPILRFNGVFADRISLYPQGGTDNVGIVGYYIYRNGVRIGPRIDPGGKYIDSTLIPGVGYVFYTTAVDDAGNESIGSAAIKADPARGM